MAQTNHPQQFGNLQALEHYLMRDDDSISSSSQENHFPLDQSPVANTEIINPDDPLVDPFIDDEIFEQGFETNPSRVQDVTNIRSSDFGNPNIQLSSWPLQVRPYTCSCCQTLREITHTNGVEITKLEIHGRLGVISHGVLEKFSVDFNANQGHEYKMFDFCKESMSRVKDFLVEYCKKRKRNGYIMLQDPLSSFYEAVCVGLDWEDSTVTHHLIQHHSGDHRMNQPNVETSRARLTNKITMSIQRERTRKLTVRDLVKYFNVPLEVAAQHTQVCPTVIKKTCRRHGLSRWPYRKINSTAKKISRREKYLTSVDPEERGRAQAEINTLQQIITNIYSRFNV